MRVVHYLNQFFGGIGAEEHAGAPLQARDGPVGPGRLLEPLLGDGTRVVLTLICGDNYAVENQEAVTASAIEKIRALKADLFFAGPCFDAGRYGMAAGALCAAIQAELNIPAITGMNEENPGVDLYRDGHPGKKAGRKARYRTPRSGRLSAPRPPARRIGARDGCAAAGGDAGGETQRHTV